MSAPPILRPLGFGEVLDSAFTLYRRNFATFVAAAAVPTLLMMVVGFLTGMHRADPAALGFAELGLFLFVALVATLVMWGALTHLASRAYGGSPATAGEGLQVGLRRFLPLLGASILALVVLTIIAFAAAMVVGILMAIFAAALGEAALAVVMVLAGLAVMAFYALAAAVFFAVVPAVVVEGRGAAGAIGRSFELARGALGRLAGLMLVSVLIVYLPILGIVVLTGTFATLYDPAAAAAAAGSTAYMLQQILTWSVGALTTPFLISVIVVQYYDRRVRTEALDVQAMTERLAMV